MHVAIYVVCLELLLFVVAGWLLYDHKILSAVHSLDGVLAFSEFATKICHSAHLDKNLADETKAN